MTESWRNSALNRQLCARWECGKQATFDKPLCYIHWQQWQAWDLEECNRCHWVFNMEEPGGWGYFCWSGYVDYYPYLCDACLTLTIRTEKGQSPPWPDLPLENIPQPLAHAKLERPKNHVYILKLSDGGFYVGQTINLDIRMREHQDGLQSQTRGKDPRLVYFEQFEGDRERVNKREDELTKLNQSPVGRRRLRELIENFRRPLKLLDLKA